MHGASIIDRLTPGPADQILTDGEQSCGRDALRDAVARVAAQLADAGIDRHDGVALECANTLPAAMTLLHLLDGGYRFMLVPDGERAGGLPAFCRYRLRASAMAGSSLSRVEAQESPAWNGRRGDSPGGLLYLPTSGSTGHARLAAHSPRHLIANALNCVGRFGLRAADRVAIPVPIFHMYGLGAAFLPALLAGASIDLQRNAQVLTWLAREQDFAPTVAFLTPSFCESLLAARRSARPYRLSVSAGDRLGEDLLARYETRHGTLLNLYGSTELGAIAACRPDDARELRGSSAGPLMPHVRCCEPQADAEPEAPNPGWQALAFVHAHGFEGYAGEDGVPQPHASAFATRDLGRIDDHGFLHVLGRSDHHVKRDGRLVSLTDVESALQRIDGIRQAAVIASEQGRRGRALVAVCVPAGPDEPDERRLRRACLDVLPKHAIPDRFVLVADLPRLPSGKLDRVRIGAMHGQGGVHAETPG